MKKLLPFIVVLIVGVIAYFISIRNFYKNKYPWENVVHVQLEKFYIDNKAEDLDVIAKLYETYSFDEEYMGKIQNKSNETVKKWFDNIKNKYICNLENYNTCLLYKKDLEDLINGTLYDLYKHDGYKNYNIISWDTYNVIKGEYDKIIQEIETIEKNPNKSRQKDYEQLRKEKCAAATECNECKNNLCICTYIDPTGSKKEFVTCKEEKKVSNDY